MVFNVIFSFSKTIDKHKYCKIKLFSGAISHGASNEPETYLEPSQKPTREHFCKNNSRLQALNYFCKKKGSIVDVRIGSKYSSVKITLHLTFLEKHGL